MGAHCCSRSQEDEQHAARHIDKQFGEGTAAALNKTALLLKKMNNRIFKTTTEHNFFISLAMIVKQCYQEQRYLRPLSTGDRFVDMAVLAKAARYARYASAAYYSEKEEILEAVEGDGKGESVEILHIHVSQTVGCPNFFVAMDKATNTIVLAVRGKPTLQDAITYTVDVSVPFMGGSAHEGILANARALVESAKPILQEAIKATPDSSVAVVGHSLGAGTAILATVQMCSSGSGLDQLAAASKLRCYAFAPPPVFEPVDKLPPLCTSAIYSFVNNMDCVPRACLGTVGGLLLAVREVDELGLTPPERLHFLTNDSPAAVHFPDYVEVPDHLGAELKFLHGVGTAVLFFEEENGKVRCEKLTQDLNNRILPHPRMVEDHLMGSYQESIDKALRQLRESKWGPSSFSSTKL